MLDGKARNKSSNSGDAGRQPGTFSLCITSTHKSLGRLSLSLTSYLALHADIRRENSRSALYSSEIDHGDPSSSCYKYCETFAN